MKVVVIGYGPGGVAAATAARAFDSKSEVIIYTGETIDAHQKPGASLALEYPNTKDLTIPEWSFKALTEKRIEVVSGVEVTSIDIANQILSGLNAKGGKFDNSYDKLVLATGGLPSIPSLPGTELKGVYTIQNMADTTIIGSNLSTMKRVVVVGAGFSGLEVAERLLTMGKEVHMIVRSRLMRSQLEEPMSDELSSRLPESLVVHQGVSPGSVVGTSQATGITLNGETLEADAVLFMTGVKPNTRLAEQMGLEIGDLGGIKINKGMETSTPGIYAVGDCVEMYDTLTEQPVLLPIGSVAARAGRQAGVAAVGGKKIYEDTALRFQYDRIFGTDIVCVGNSSVTATNVGIETKVSYLEDSAEFSKVALVTDNDGRLIGGQVLTSRQGARLGYQILERVESGAVISERPLLEPRHKRMKDLIEQTLGPIQ
ncbi:MAG: FAD-dependent oxidoreductase [Candidatus Thorarchaeota archaeon]|nr:FAD-dependent oxidoreductase [Candidatus Thorarchaeota archaeon]